MNWNESVVLVTGASKGIGLEVARLMAAKGALVVLAARSAKKLQAEVSKLKAAGYRADWVKLDVTSEKSVTSATRKILLQHGAIDVLVNNAGTAEGLAYWLAEDPEKMRRLIDVHLLGMASVTRAVLPSMLSQKRGIIMNVGSTVGFVPMPVAASYSAAKAAVIAYTEALRGELLGQGLRIELFVPPHTQTNSGAEFQIKLPHIYSVADTAHALIRQIEGKRMSFSMFLGTKALQVVQRFSHRYAAKIMRDIGLEAAHRLGLARGSRKTQTRFP